LAGERQLETFLGGKGVAVLFFTIVIALFTYFIYYLAKGNTDPAYYWQHNTPRTEAPLRAHTPVSQKPSAVKGKSVILIRNKAKILGKLRIAYLGRADKYLRFDVNILDLDSDFAYRYTISQDRAKKHFRIADQYFKISTASNSKIRLSQMSLE
jgi:hypothetical protein